MSLTLCNPPDPLYLSKKPGQRRPSKFKSRALVMSYIFSSLLNSLINVLPTDLMQARHSRPSTSGTPVLCTFTKL